MGYHLFLCKLLLLWEGLIPKKNTRTDKQLSLQLLISTCPLPLTPVQTDTPIPLLSGTALHIPSMS